MKKTICDKCGKNVEEYSELHCDTFKITLGGIDRLANNPVYQEFSLNPAHNQATPFIYVDADLCKKCLVEALKKIKIKDVQ